MSIAQLPTSISGSPRGIQSGLRVIEYPAYVAVPLSGLTLAQLGADVIRIDPLGGNMDISRWPVDTQGRSLYWASLNRGKRSVELDVRSPRGRQLLAKLMAATGPDGRIFVTNLPVSQELIYEELSSGCPGLIMVQLIGSPDGQPALDYTVSCAVGFPYLTGDGRPVNHVLPAWDVIAGLTIALAILAAERRRRSSGKGQCIRLALSDIAMSTVSNLGYIAEAQLLDYRRRADGNFLFGAYGDSLATADGRDVRAMEEMIAWGGRVAAEGNFGELESLLLEAALSEYLAQIAGGLPMSQGEIFRIDALFEELASIDPDAASDLGHSIAAFRTAEPVKHLIANGSTAPNRKRIADLLVQGHEARTFGALGFHEPELIEIRAQFARYANDHAEDAHRWHLADRLIPDDVVEELAGIGVFGLTIAPEFGGSGMGKAAMCVVTEELSRGFIGLGSLGTRAEIAAELIGVHGTEPQKAALLPKIADGSLLPAAAFTEPDYGSDLASLRTRAERHDSEYRIYGNNTWTTHAARSDLLAMLVRTNPDERGFRGLSLLLVPKPRRTDEVPFPANGMTDTEIQVLGYRGMKEYEVAFDGFPVPSSALLGGVEDAGFKQLMATFESARIQTAARAIGVAQCAMELALDYALARSQFGRPIIDFPRVSDKVVWMAVETMLARQLCLYAARRKDEGTRCDLEAGMAKLLAARVAWSNADNAVQIHGGNGYAQEFAISRVLCDARILSIFEGAAEIQAQVIGRTLLSDDETTDGRRPTASAAENRHER